MSVSDSYGSVITPAIAVIGDGRMGRAVAQMIRERGWYLTAVLGSAANPDGSGISRRALGDPDVALEFTEPGAAVANIMACIREGVPLVVGTTGWYDSLGAVTEAVTAAGGSVVWSPSFSPGATMFVELAREAGRIMASSGFPAELVETRHSSGRDAPSGAAMSIAGSMSASLGASPPVTSVRAGPGPESHEVRFEGTGEQIVLRHSARDRRVNAGGALRAAIWIRGRTGVFTMRDVLGFAPPREEDAIATTARIDLAEGGAGGGSR